MIFEKTNDSYADLLQHVKSLGYSKACILRLKRRLIISRQKKKTSHKGKPAGCMRGAWNSMGYKNITGCHTEFLGILISMADAQRERKFPFTAQSIL